jgi:hypothetical protein
VPAKDWGAELESLRSLIAAEKRTLEDADNRLFWDYVEVKAELDKLKQAVAELEDSQRPSRVSNDIEEQIAKVLEKLDKRSVSSDPPSSTAEVRTASGNRVRAPVWAAIVLALIVLAIVSIWQAEDLAAIVKSLRK